MPLSLGPLDRKWRQARESPLSLDVLEQMCVEGVDMIKGTPDDDKRQAEDEQHGQTERGIPLGISRCQSRHATQYGWAPMPRVGPTESWSPARVYFQRKWTKMRPKLSESFSTRW